VVSFFCHPPHKELLLYTDLHLDMTSTIVFFFFLKETHDEIHDRYLTACRSSMDKARRDHRHSERRMKRAQKEHSLPGPSSRSADWLFNPAQIKVDDDLLHLNSCHLSYAFALLRLLIRLPTSSYISLFDDV
jgi:hypothetical protein